MPPNQQNPYNPYSQQPQQNGNGGYDVVPPLPGAPSAGHSGHNPYEFIVNPQQPHRRKLFGGGSAMKPLLIVVSLAIVLVIALVIAVSLFAPKGPTAELTSIAERQQEIVRVATAASQSAQGQDTKNFVATVQAVVASDQTQILNYLSSHGTKLQDKDLALDQSAQTDSLLASAQSSNTYDSTVDSYLLDQLGTYQGLLKTAYGDTDNTGLKQTLQNSYRASATLVQQGKVVQSD